MIVEWLADMVLRVLTNLVGVFPAPDVFIGDISAGLGMLMTFNALAPLDSMLAGALVLMAVQTSVFFFHMVRMFLSHIPFIGGSG